MRRPERHTPRAQPKRLVMTALAGLAALALLAGCGGSSDSDEAETTDSTRPPLSQVNGGKKGGGGSGEKFEIKDPRFDPESPCGLADSILFRVYVSGNLDDKTAEEKLEIGNAINEKADKLSEAEPDLATPLDAIVAWETDHLNGGDDPKPEWELKTVNDFVDECVANQ